MNQTSVKKIAVLDVDGTLIKGQIQKGLINFFYIKGKIRLSYLIILNIWFILYRLGITDRVQDIYNFGVSFLKDETVDDVSLLVDEYIEEKIRPEIYPRTFPLITSLKTRGYRIILLSTAVDIVIMKLAKLFDSDDYISTKLQVNNGYFTGKVEGDIVYGETKVSVLNDYLALNSWDLSNVVAYADHESDISLLKTVGQGYIANPSKKMRKLSIENNIGTIDMNIHESI